MLFSYTVILLPSAVCLLLMFVIILRKWQRKSKQKEGLKGLIDLHKVLSTIQLHRGLSCGFLNGKKESLLEIELLHGKIQSHIELINESHPWAKHDDQWTSIQQHWFRLSTGFRFNTNENNLLQHRLLIKNILSTIESIGTQHELHFLALNSGDSFSVLWRKLLFTAETIGQARALGHGVTACGLCTESEKIKLSLLCKKITQTTSNLWNTLPPINEQEQLVKILLFCIKEQLIKEDVTIDSEQFFKIATEAMESLYEGYDSIIKDKQWALNKQIL